MNEFEKRYIGIMLDDMEEGITVDIGDSKLIDTSNLTHIGILNDVLCHIGRHIKDFKQLIDGG